MRRTKKLLSLGLALTLVGTCFCGCKKKENYDEDEKQESTEPLEDMMPRPVLQPKLKEAQEKNEDAVAWLNIPGTNIDYPVMQSEKDYTPAAGEGGYYYHRRAQDKSYRLCGSIYSFKECNFESRKKLSYNTFIAGHNMEEGDGKGEMFAELMKYMDINFANEHPYVFLSLPDQDLVFQVFAVYITEIPFTKYSPRKAFIYYGSDFCKSNGDVTKGGDGSKPARTLEGKNYSFVQAVATKAKQKSLYNYPVKLTKKSKIITLSTCCYQYGHTLSPNCIATKFVVQGVLIPASKKLRDKAYLTKNENPEPPQGLPRSSDFVYECEGELVQEEDGKVVEVKQSDKEGKKKS